MLNRHSKLIDSLGSEPELVFQFFCLFSRFEYALKRSPRFLKKQERAEADWDSFGNSLMDRFKAVIESQFVSALKYLESNPPKRQVVRDGQLAWSPSEPRNGERRELYILRLVRTVRNNLFHGGKYPYPAGPVSDVTRNRQLLEACISVLEQCLLLSPDVEESFDEAA